MLKLDLSRESRRFLDVLPAKQFRQVVRKVLSLMADPEPPDSILIKGSPYRRADPAQSGGEYRIVYQVREDCLAVFVIGKRNDDEVYRFLKA